MEHSPTGRERMVTNTMGLTYIYQRVYFNVYLGAAMCAYISGRAVSAATGTNNFNRKATSPLFSLIRALKQYSFHALFLSYRIWSHSLFSAPRDLGGARNCCSSLKPPPRSVPLLPPQEQHEHSHEPSTLSRLRSDALSVLSISNWYVPSSSMVKPLSYFFQVGRSGRQKTIMNPGQASTMIATWTILWSPLHPQEATSVCIRR